MNGPNSYHYSLDNSSRKFKCPSCGYKRFVLYKVNDSSQYFPHRVGRCDREQSCGYHYTPKQYFQENKNDHMYNEAIRSDTEKIDFIPVDFVQKSMNDEYLK